MPTRAKPEQPAFNLPRIDREALEGVRQNPTDIQEGHKALFDGNNEEFALEIRRRLMEIPDLADREKAAVVVFGALEAISNQRILDEAAQAAKNLTAEYFIKPPE